MSWHSADAGKSRGGGGGKGSYPPGPGPSSTRPGSGGPPQQQYAPREHQYAPRISGHAGMPAPSQSQRPGGCGGPPGQAPPTYGGGGSQSLNVSGCGNPTVSNIIKGSYSVQGSNHGRSVYKREGPPGSVSVLIYFWDERDGASFSGWWFGPKVGGDQVWAYNSDQGSSPPLANWKVPWDGDVDHTLRISQGGGSSGGCGAGGGFGGCGSGGCGGRPMPAPAPAQRGPPPEVLRQQEEDRRRREAAERQRQQQEQQQRQQQEQQRREEERRRREAEDRKRRQREEEDRARREAEARRRREEEETRRREQAAVLTVRKIIQLIRVATPENFDGLRAELQEVQSKELEALGSQAPKVSQEAQEALQQAQKRIDSIKEKRAEDERKRQEEEKRAKEEAEKVQKLLGEVTADVERAEAKAAEAQDSAKGITEDNDKSPEAMAEAAGATEKVLEATKAMLEKSLKSLDEKWTEMGNCDAARKVRREMDELNGKLLAGRRQLEKLATVVSSTRDKAARKAAALKKDRERRASFEKHDADQDGQLSRDEVTAFSKVELGGFEVPEDALDRIMRILEPITYEKFHTVHLKVAIARSEVMARAKRAEEAERLRKLEEQKQEVQKVVSEASDLLAEGEKLANNAEEKVRPLNKETIDMPSTEIDAIASEGEALVKQAESQLAAALAKLKKVEEKCEANPDLSGFDRKDVPRLRKKTENVEARTEKVTAALKKAREHAIRKAYAEMDQKRLDVVAAIRTKMGAESKTGEQLFTGIDGGAALKCEKFCEFLKGQSEVELQDGLAEKLFQHIAGEAEDIGKERFLELIRLYYKCVKGTVLNEDISIKSKTLRRIEPGEVLEVLEGPSKEEGVNVQRVRCQSVQDGAVGWVTIAGNQGTPFLEPGGNFYSVVKETLLTDGLSVQDSKTLRRIAKGEVIEVLEFQKKDASVDVKRIKGKAKLDGATGWITVASNQGTVFLEPC